MKTQWLNKNTSLTQLKERIEQFLRNENFEFSLKEDPQKTSVFAFKRQDDQPLTVIITIEGEPADFTVETRGKEVSESAYMFTHFLSLFGMGGLLAKKMDLLAVYRVFEDRFFAYLDDAVDQLKNSATEEKTH